MAPARWTCSNNLTRIRPNSLVPGTKSGKLNAVNHDFWHWSFSRFVLVLSCTRIDKLKTKLQHNLNSSHELCFKQICQFACSPILLLILFLPCFIMLRSRRIDITQIVFQFCAFANSQENDWKFFQNKKRKLNTGKKKSKGYLATNFLLKK